MGKRAIYLTFLILLFLNVLVVFLVDVFTIKMLPHRAISGNGNPGIILWFFFFPLYLPLLFLTGYLVYKKNTNEKLLKISILCSTV